jgi:hypothetical protein
MSHQIRRFEPADREAMLAFADSLPEHDLLFLGRDLRHPRVIEAWLGAIEEGWIYSIAMDRGLTKLTAQMTPDQVGSVMLFESLGFRAEALLKDHVRDRAGNMFDLALLSQDVARVTAQHRAFGLDA